MLEAIWSLDPEANDITRFVESYMFNSLSCRLSRFWTSLWDLMRVGEFTPSSLNEIISVIHSYLKHLMP